MNPGKYFFYALALLFGALVSAASNLDNLLSEAEKSIECRDQVKLELTVEELFSTINSLISESGYESVDFDKVHKLFDTAIIADNVEALKFLIHKFNTIYYPFLYLASRTADELGKFEMVRLMIDDESLTYPVLPKTITHCIQTRDTELFDKIIKKCDLEEVSDALAVAERSNNFYFVDRIITAKPHNFTQEYLLKHFENSITRGAHSKFYPALE